VVAHLLHWHFVTSRLQSLAACDIVIILRASYGEYAVTAAAAAAAADGGGDAGGGGAGAPSDDGLHCARNAVIV